MTSRQNQEVKPSAGRLGYITLMVKAADLTWKGIWPKSWLKARHAQYERSGEAEREFGYLSRLVRPRQIALDIGCLDGVFAYEMSRYTDRVIAFEPNPRCLPFLRRALPSNVSVEPVALSDQNGCAELRIPKGQFGRLVKGLGTIEIANKLDFGEISAVRVQTCRLDNYKFKNVGFMKIDVEGHESEVLCGAQETIARCRPNLLIEVEERHRPGAIRSVFDQMVKIGYEGRFIAPGTNEVGRVQSIQEFVVELHQSRDHHAELLNRIRRDVPYVNNFIFTPREGTPDPIA